MVTIDILQLNPTSYTDLTAFVLNVINWAIAFGAFAAIIGVIVGGFRFIFSMGDDKKIEAAGRSLVFAILGMILIFLSPTIVKFVITNFLGLTM